MGIIDILCGALGGMGTKHAVCEKCGDCLWVVEQNSSNRIIALHCANVDCRNERKCHDIITLPPGYAIGITGRVTASGRKRKK